MPSGSQVCAINSSHSVPTICETWASVCWRSSPESSGKLPLIRHNAVLVAEDLTPSDTAAMERGKVMGFATVRGGATSHVAILARSLGIPALAGIDARALELPNGTPVILDGSKGTLRLNPSAEEMKQLREAQIRHEEQRKEDLSHALEPATTTDGHHVEVAANIGGVKDAGQVAELGGDGVGLLRSEFLFMERSSAPSEDEQFEEYKAIALALGADRPVIIRTLDVGGDKPLAYLPIPKEDNPFLGERGIRVGLDRPEILRTQLRALLRASEFGKLRIMFPMIATMAELRDAKAILAEEAKSARNRPNALRNHGGNACRGRHGRGFCQRSRFLLDRHERPHPIHPCDGSRSPQARSEG